MYTRQLHHKLASANGQLAQELDRICEQAEAIWDQQHLREFTVHGGAHFRQVEDNLDALTASLQQGSHALTTEEVFVLIAACYLHDIGMQLDVPDAREKHAQYAYELILSSSARIGPDERRVTLPISNPNARTAIAKVARGHWTTFALALPEEDFIYENERGRLKLLGLLLANADLLDTSAIRAGYFRGDHRLFDLSAISELHQTMHELVCGYQIKPALSSDSDTLIFELEWRDRSQLVRDISEWQLRWFSSQLRLLAPELERLAGGRVRWASPWARVVFRAPEGPMPTLGEQARGVLTADLASQRRIDRDEFANQFRHALAEPASIVLVLPDSSVSDARYLADWAHAHAANEAGSLVARIDIGGGDPIEISSVVATLLEQWGEHLPECDDNEALRSLRRFVLEKSTSKVVLIARADADVDILGPILRELLRQPGVPPQTSRVCVLLGCSRGEFRKIRNVTQREFDLSSFTRIDVESHLVDRNGYSVQESHRIVANMERVGLLSRPAHVYTYLEDHCDRTAWREQTP